MVAGGHGSTDEGEVLGNKPKNEWNLYIAECTDGSYYTGIAKDVEKRIETHNSGKGSKYTATHTPVKLVLQEYQADYSASLRRQYQINRLPQRRKRRVADAGDLPRHGKTTTMSRT